MRTIELKNEGSIYCESSYYTTSDGMSAQTVYKFKTGLNKMIGDIDSGVWAPSYLLSMFSKVNQRTLFLPLNAIVDGMEMPLSELTKNCCYMDTIYPLFSSKRRSVHQLVDRGLKLTKSTRTVNDIKELFCLDSERFERPVFSNGNEKIRAMGAVGYAYGKDVFCFPWYSQMRYESYHNHMPWLMDKLTALEKIVILPLGT